MATVFVNSKWRQPSSCFSVTVLVFDMKYPFYIEFATCSPNMLITGEIVKQWQAFFEIQNGGNRHLTFLLLSVFRHDSCVSFLIRIIPTKFGEDWSHSKEMTAVIRNPRWRRQPCCKKHFRLDSQFEKGVPSLSLPIKNPTFVGLSSPSRIVYS